MPVLLGRPKPDGLERLDKVFWLIGAGEGLRVVDVNHAYVEQGQVQEGDVVMTVGDEIILPLPVVIGRVTEILPDRSNGLLHVLEVTPAVRPERLRRVLIVNMQPPEPER
jgi:cell shape-determining protein MreC